MPISDVKQGNLRKITYGTEGGELTGVVLVLGHRHGVVWSRGDEGGYEFHSVIGPGATAPIVWLDAGLGEALRLARRELWNGNGTILPDGEEPPNLLPSVEDDADIHVEMLGEMPCDDPPCESDDPPGRDPRLGDPSSDPEGLVGGSAGFPSLLEIKHGTVLGIETGGPHKGLAVFVLGSQPELDWDDDRGLEAVREAMAEGEDYPATPEATAALEAAAARLGLGRDPLLNAEDVFAHTAEDLESANSVDPALLVRVKAKYSSWRFRHMRKGLLLEVARQLGMDPLPTGTNERIRYLVASEAQERPNLALAIDFTTLGVECASVSGPSD